jgi:uncharacterized surface protein with fasciclin (FAS1) repeats
MKILMVLALMLLGGVSLVGAQSEGIARIRAAHYALDVPAVDVLVDDVLIAEALAFQAATQHIAVEAGEHRIRFVTDESVSVEATVTLDAETDYTIAQIGQLADDSARLLVIDERAAVADVRVADEPASYAVLVHGISNGPAVDFSLDGEELISGLTFGEYEIVRVTQAPHDIVVTFADDPDAVLFENSGETPPSNNLLLLTVMAGSYPDALDVTGAVSRLPNYSVLDFLTTYQDEAGNSFTTLLEAIEIAGLTETLAQERAFTLFAPTDAAFAQLPPETLELLFAYPAALREVLLGHVVGDVFSARDLTDTLTLTTEQGGAVVVTRAGEGYTINGDAAVLFGTFPAVVNGNVIGIDRLLLPQD